MLHDSLDREAYIKTDGKLMSTLKVMHISTSGDAKVAASYSLIVGQIRSDEGHDNHTNGMSPEENMVWGTGSNTYNGDVEKQYANVSYTEVWFRESSLEVSAIKKK